MPSAFDPSQLERFIVGGLLAALAVAVAFGPELRRALGRVRARDRAAARALTSDSVAS